MLHVIFLIKKNNYLLRMSIFLLNFADRLNKLFFSYPRIYAGFIGFFSRSCEAE